MKKIKFIWGLPITIEIVDQKVKAADIEEIFKYFKLIDQKFSTYKKTSEISLINQGKITANQYSQEMTEIFKLADQTKTQTQGYFNIEKAGQIDPSGLVKGWAIWQAAKKLKQQGFKNFYINAGGDIQSFGQNQDGRDWLVGIRNPFKINEIVKVISPKDHGVATSGTYERGNHIYNPQTGKTADDIVGLTIIGPNIYEADRFATAAFAMGKPGIGFIENLPGFEAYMIDKNGLATLTSGFEEYVTNENN